MRKFVVYMLRCADGSLYTGYTSDIRRRLELHRTGRGSRYVRSRLPVTLAYAEAAADRSAAMKREVELKRLSRKEKLSLVKKRAPRRGLR